MSQMFDCFVCHTEMESQIECMLCIVGCNRQSEYCIQEISILTVNMQHDTKNEDGFVFYSDSRTRLVCFCLFDTDTDAKIYANYKILFLAVFV